MSLAEKSKLAAWKDVMPGKVPSLLIQGTVPAPTPCHEPHITKVPDDPGAPDRFKTRLEFEQRPGNCPEVETMKEVRYVEHNYTGDYSEVEVRFPDDSVATTAITIVQ